MPFSQYVTDRRNRILVATVSAVGVVIAAVSGGSPVPAYQTENGSGQVTWQINTDGKQSGSGGLVYKGPVAFKNLTGCDSIDTSATGQLLCGSDATGAGGSSFGTGNVVSMLASYVRKAGGTMTGALTINVTGGTATTVGLNVIQLLSGATIHASAVLRSSGALIVEGLSTLQGGATVTGTVSATDFDCSNCLTASDLAANSVDASELVATAVAANTYGTALNVPQFTVDADGRLTAASVNTIAGLNGSHITDDTLDFVDLDDTLDLDANTSINSGGFALVWNEDGDAAGDFRVEGDTNANLLFVDASADSVGLGVASPTAFLHVQGSTTAEAATRVFSGATVTAPNDGDGWYDRAKKALMLYYGGAKQGVNTTLFSTTADKSVANTASETSLVGTGTGTVTLPANFMIRGKAIRVTVRGYYSTTGSPTLVFRMKTGGNTSCNTATNTAPTGVTSEMFEVSVVLNLRTVGSAGNIVCQGWSEVSTSATATQRWRMVNTGFPGFDTTVSRALDVTAQWGTASPSNTITAQETVIELLN